jgi:hypothetical protein
MIHYVLFVHMVLVFDQETIVIFFNVYYVKLKLNCGMRKVRDANSPEKNLFLEKFE